MKIPTTGRTGRRVLALALLVVVSLAVGYFGWRWSQRVEARRFRAAARPRAPIRAARTGTLPRQLRESSGVAASRTQPGVLWTHNDSGDAAAVYAVDFSGNILGEYELDDTQARDWEDIALGPCPRFPGDCLFIAETGDNQRRRSSYRVNVVREPTVDPEDHASEKTIPTLGGTLFEYPGGISEDAEALAVAPDGEVLVITKGRSGSVQVFSLGVLEPADGDDRVTARLVVTLPIQPRWAIGRMVTGAAFSADGTRLAVRTYSEVFFFTRTASGGFAPAGEPCFVSDLAYGGEAVDFLGDSALVLTSERAKGKPGAIDIITCR